MCLTSFLVCPARMVTWLDLFSFLKKKTFRRACLSLEYWFSQFKNGFLPTTVTSLRKKLISLPEQPVLGQHSHML